MWCALCSRAEIGCARWCARMPMPRALDGLDCELVRGDLRDIAVDRSRRARTATRSIMSPPIIVCGCSMRPPMYASNVERHAQRDRSRVTRAGVATNRSYQHRRRAWYSAWQGRARRHAGRARGYGRVRTSARSFWPSRSRSKPRAQGLPVVIVNPSTPIGALDYKPTPTGRIIVDFLNRRMPALHGHRAESRSRRGCRARPSARRGTRAHR